MNLDRQAFRVMEAALEMPHEQRADFLAEACEDDSKLKAKVQVLMDAVDDDSNFLATRDTVDSPTPHSTRQRLGEYRIVREIGRGGMGVVYEAEQDSMQRRVALKLLSIGSSPSECQIARFYREARAAGRLHHTNIVPVFDVSCEDGFHYYTMQFIDGVNLDTLIDEVRKLREGEAKQSDALKHSVAWRFCFESGARHSTESSRRTANASANSVAVKATAALSLSSDSSGSVFALSDVSQTARRRDTYFRRVASIGLQVAEALEYAHRNGVLHRDIKPSNLILDKAGTAWVFDFGLAKSGQDRLTATGDVIGTIRYMAPERFDGDTDPKSEVYSLGLTLYELATLQHAFDAKDRSSLFKQITSQTPKPPRAIDPQIPRDLETIILKAIDRAPQRRYSSAEAFADDLRHFLSDESIAARRITLLERAWRTCRRNPIASSLALMLLSALAVIAFGSARFAYISHQKTLQAERAEKATRHRRYELNVQAARAVRQSKRAGRRFEAIAAIEAASLLLPTLDYSAAQVEAEKCMLRSEVASALGLFDMRQIRELPTDDIEGRCYGMSCDLSRMAVGNHHDGNIIVTTLRTAQNDETLQVDNDSTLHLRASNGATFGLAFSRDGRFLASQNINSNTHLNVWNVDRSSRNFDTPIISRPSHHHCFVEFAADNSFVAIGAPESLAIYDLPSGELRTEIELRFTPRKIQLSHDGVRVAVAPLRSRIIEIWNLESGLREQTFQVPEDTQPLRTFAWSSERNLLIAGLYDGKLLIWNGAHASEPECLSLHRHTVVKICLHPHEPIVLTESWDETVRVVDLVTKLPTCRLERYQIASRCWHRNGTQIGLTSVEDGRIGIWEVAQPCLRRTRLDRTQLDATYVHRSAETHPLHPQLMLTAHHERIALCCLRTGSTLASFRDFGTPFAQFSEDGQSLFVLSNRGCVRVPLTVQTPSRPSGCLSVDVGVPISLTDALPGASRFDLAGDEQSVLVTFHANTDRAFAERIPFDAKQSPVRFGPHVGMSSAVLSPDGCWVATAAWKRTGVRVWNASTGELATERLGDIAGSFCCFSSDSRSLFAAQKQALYGWAVESWQPLNVAAQRKVGIMGDISVSSDNRLLAAHFTRYCPQLIDPNTGRCVLRLEDSIEDAIRSYSLSHDASQLAVGGTEYAYVWDLGRVRQQLASLQLDWSEGSRVRPSALGRKTLDRKTLGHKTLRQATLPTSKHVPRR